MLADDTLMPGKRTIHGKQDEQTRYLMNVLENSPNTVMYHKAGIPGNSRIVLTSIIFTFLPATVVTRRANIVSILLKRLLKTRGSHPYNVSVQKVYNRHGLSKYLTEDPTARYVVAADNIQTSGQKHMLTSLTDRHIPTTDKTSSDDEVLEDRKTTVRGQSMSSSRK